MLKTYDLKLSLMALTGMVIVTCVLAAEVPDRTSPELLAEDDGWKVVAGEFAEDDDEVELMGEMVLQRKCTLRPGLYELQVKGSGTGQLVLGAGEDTSRVFRITTEPGLYGLLFQQDKETPRVLEINLEGGEKAHFTLTEVALVEADAERRAAWTAARESYELLGYYGSDPQRPAPGAGVPAALPVYSPENLERWAIRETVVFHDPAYDSHWMEDDAGIAAFFTRRGLEAKSARETETWLREHSLDDRGVGTSIILAMGVAPANCLSRPFKDCLLAQYLRAGGRVVWLAGVPLYVTQGEKGPKMSIAMSPSEEILGLEIDRKTFYGMDGPTLTSVGKDWGLEPASGLPRPVKTSSVTLSFVADPSGKFTGVGMVNLRPDLPLSGFAFIPDAASPGREDLLRNAYRLARFSGKPVTVPEAAPLPSPAIPLEAALRLDESDRRMVFVRGESLPLFMRLKAIDPDLKTVDVRFQLCEKGHEATLREGGATVSISEEQADILLGALDLSGLRRGRYTLTARISAGEEAVMLDRELRIAPAPDMRGFHLAVWCKASPKVSRTEDLLDDLAAHNVEPMFVGDYAVGRDLALWYGMSFSTRHHGYPKNIPNPPGYDNYRRGGSGQIMRIRAQGDKRESKGYASPFRRQAEADAFGQLVAFDSKFPAFRQRTVTADDYSQWFGMDYNRFAVEGFRARYGIDPPVPKEAEDPYGTPSLAPPPGVIPDAAPWLLLNRYWAETLGDSGRRLSRAMEAATGGHGKVGPVPGGMLIPVLSVWSGQYPPFNFGERDGFTLSCFYYYNTFWQPPLAHLWWLEAARMGNRGIEQWMMPDCYVTHMESYYRNNQWLMLAGGARGLPYFRYEERKDAAMRALKTLGAWIQRHGLLLDAMRPAPKKVAMLVPFENVTYRIGNGYAMAYSFMNLLLAKVDAEPVSPEELDPVSIQHYEAVVLAQVEWLKASTVKLLENYIVAGGKVIVDSVGAKALPIKGAVTLDFPIGKSSRQDYAQPDRLAEISHAFQRLAPPEMDCDQPLVAMRRTVLPDGTPGLWLIHNYSQEEYARIQPDIHKLTPVEARAIEDEMGYRRDVVTVTVTRPDDGGIPLDVESGNVLDVVRSDGKMSIKVQIPKWEGRLLLFPTTLPKSIELLSLPEQVVPGLPVELGVHVRDADGRLLDMPVPLRLVVRDPEGHESREYSRRMLTEKGAVIQHLTFAVNDLRGEWTLAVEDELTGIRTQSYRFQLK